MKKNNKTSFTSKEDFEEKKLQETIKNRENQTSALKRILKKINQNNN